MRRHAVAGALVGVLVLTGCASSPEADLNEALTEVVERANAQDPGDLRLAVDDLLAVINRQSGQDLDPEQAQSLRAAAEQVREDADLLEVVATPTPTPTRSSASPSATPSPSPTPSPTPSPSPSATPSPTPSRTPTPSATSTPTSSESSGSGDEDGEDEAQGGGNVNGGDGNGGNGNGGNGNGGNGNGGNGNGGSAQGNAGPDGDRASSGADG